MTIHASAAKGFSAAAETYVRGRPDYPPDVGRWLVEAIGLAPGRSAVEIGAGTGKFLPLLRATGAAISAVEPVAEMRAQMLAANPEITVLAGTAEAIPLADASADAVVCAQAFHWFANREALTEIYRVLRPEAILGLIWNVRDESVPWVAALTRITEPYRTGTPHYSSDAWRRVLPGNGFVSAGEHAALHTHIGTAQKVMYDRTLSISFIAALPEADRAAIITRIASLIKTTPELRDAASVTFPYVTRMYAFRKQGP